MGPRNPSCAHTSLDWDVLLPLTPSVAAPPLCWNPRLSAAGAARSQGSSMERFFLETADALRSNARLRPTLIQITPLALWDRQLKLPATHSNSVDLTALLTLLQPLDLASDTRLRGG